jgi:hypothetical protein
MPGPEVVRLFESTMTASLANDDDLDRDYRLTHSSHVSNLRGRSLGADVRKGYRAGD